MEIVPFPQIVGPTYSLASLNAECQRCVNMYLEKIESGDGYYLRETPGLLQVVGGAGQGSFSSVPIRDIYKCANGRMFLAFSDNSLYEITNIIDSNGNLTMTFIGALSTSSYPLKWRMCDNVNGLWIILDKDSGFVTNYDPDYGLASYNFSTSGFHSIAFTRSGFLGSKFLGFLDQYLITLCSNVGVSGKLTTQFQISPINVGTEDAWDATDVFDVESSPDNLNSMVVNGREVWFFGPESYEVWYHTEDTLVFFARIPGAAYPIGCLAPESVQSFQGAVFWLGASKEGFGLVLMSEGYQAKRISTTAIEHIIQAMTIASDAISWTYQMAGHACYVLSFPSENITLQYDLMTQQWSELSYRDPDTQALSMHRIAKCIFAFNKNLAIDYFLGKVYEYSPNVFTDNEAPIVRYRRTPVSGQGKREIFYHKLELDMEVGVGLNGTDYGSDPVMSLRWSRDGAMTWSNYITKSIGKIGEYLKQVIWNRLGSDKSQRVFEIYMDQPVPFRIKSAELGITIGKH